MYKPLMGCSLFSNSHFQMGVTVMGFAEHFGLGLSSLCIKGKSHILCTERAKRCSLGCIGGVTFLIPPPPVSLFHVCVLQDREKNNRQAQKVLLQGTNYIDPSFISLSLNDFVFRVMSSLLVLVVSFLYWKERRKKMLRTLSVVNHRLTLEKRLD